MGSGGQGASARGDSRAPHAVLHLLTSRVRGGAEEHALSILLGMREFGFEPHLAAPAQLLALMEPELAAAGVKCRAVEFSSPLDVVAGARLSRLLRQERIEILHCHLFIASLMAAGFARMTRVPAVIETCHGPEVWRMDKGRRGSFWRGSFFIDRQVGRLVDRYIAVSHAAARHLVETKGVPGSKVTVIHNGRDLSRYRPLGAHERASIRGALGLGDGPALLTLARLDAQKGHSFLIDAIAQLAPRFPKLTALLAGDGPLEAALRAQAAQLGISDRIKFLGYRDDAPRLLEAADLVVLPSLYEGLPLVAIEALAVGRPLVATAVDGTPEVVLDGKTGLLVPPADSRALAAAIERLLLDPALAARLGAAGRAYVHENFGLRKQIEETIALYRELTGQPEQIEKNKEGQAA